MRSVKREDTASPKPLFQSEGDIRLLDENFCHASKERERGKDKIDSIRNVSPIGLSDW